MNFNLWWEVEQTRIIIGVVVWIVIMIVYSVLKHIGKLPSLFFKGNK